jgi:hypothetical protein
VDLVAQATIRAADPDRVSTPRHDAAPIAAPDPARGRRVPRSQPEPACRAERQRLRDSRELNQYQRKNYGDLFNRAWRYAYRTGTPLKTGDFGPSSRATLETGNRCGLAARRSDDPDHMFARARAARRRAQIKHGPPTDKREPGRA